MGQPHSTSKSTVLVRGLGRDMMRCEPDESASKRSLLAQERLTSAFRFFRSVPREGEASVLSWPCLARRGIPCLSSPGHRASFSVAPAQSAPVTHSHTQRELARRPAMGQWRPRKPRRPSLTRLPSFPDSLVLALPLRAPLSSRNAHQTHVLRRMHVVMPMMRLASRL